MQIVGIIDDTQWILNNLFLHLRLSLEINNLWWKLAYLCSNFVKIIKFELSETCSYNFTLHHFRVCSNKNTVYGNFWYNFIFWLDFSITRRYCFWWLIMINELVSHYLLISIITFIKTRSKMQLYNWCIVIVQHNSILQLNVKHLKRLHNFESGN